MVKNFTQQSLNFLAITKAKSLTLLEPPRFGDFRKNKQQFLVALPTP